MIESLEEASCDRFGGFTMRDQIVELQNVLYEWSRTTFSYRKHPTEAIAVHLSKEALEVVQKPNDIEEYADCLILFLNLISHSQFSLAEVLEEARKKHEVNTTRTWGQPDPQTGIIAHVRSGNEKEHAAERIAACVRSCDGISTWALEYGIIQQMIEARQEMLDVIQGEANARRSELLESRLRLIRAKLLREEAFSKP